MQNHELNKQLRKIEKLIADTTSVSSGNLEIQAHWAKYICVLSAGFLENAISIIYISFVENAASKPVVNYTSKKLAKIQNPKTAKFLEVAKSFKEEWYEDLEAFVKDNGRKDAVDAIMKHRHQIAHGKDSGITISLLKDWLNKAKEVIKFIENQCKK